MFRTQQNIIIAIILVLFVKRSRCEETVETTISTSEYLTDTTAVNGTVNEIAAGTSAAVQGGDDEKKRLQENLRDIAYYLRAHKFNEYDRRYETVPLTAPRTYFKEFPRPPLRSLHWEVKKHCEPSFKECVEYMSKKLKYTAIKRDDDTAVVMQAEGWTFVKDWEMIRQIEKECLRLKILDDEIADPFEGPLERFQWRTTASYYMCWYTMQEIAEMEHLQENCDNFASCLDPVYKANNRDPRTDDSIAFGCARYSFCPDPCCPNKHLSRMHDCWNTPDNPCFRNNPAGQRKCTFNRTLNTEFSDMILNRWNVSCKCQRKGFEWNSFFGICIDVDECDDGGSHNCDRNSEACVNLEGGFRCACKWGHIWSKEEKRCVPSAALALIKLDRRDDNEKEEKNKTRSLFRRIMGYFKRSKGNVPSSNLYMILLFSLISIPVGH